MSAAHTPAPWVVKFRNDSSCYISMGSPADEHKQFDLELSAHYPSDVADARLIAAAPDLLAALQVVVADWTQQFERNGSQAPAWCRQARNAIAKATGEGA